MKLLMQTPYIILNVFTLEQPQGQSFEVSIPAYANSVAVDSNGMVNAFAVSKDQLIKTAEEWDTGSPWHDIADLEFIPANWADLRWDLDEDEDESIKCRGVFAIYEEQKE